MQGIFYSMKELLLYMGKKTSRFGECDGCLVKEDYSKFCFCANETKFGKPPGQKKQCHKNRKYQSIIELVHALVSFWLYSTCWEPFKIGIGSLIAVYHDIHFVSEFLHLETLSWHSYKVSRIIGS